MRRSVGTVNNRTQYMNGMLITGRETQQIIIQTLRCNVDLIHAIQLRITFADEQGNHHAQIINEGRL
ncbi:hypothetical protein V1521DRAFT_440185 [Lipomyces starkeyi]